MAKKDLDSLPEISSGKQAWDVTVQDALEQIRAFLTQTTLPVPEPGTNPVASQHDRSIYMKDVGGGVWHLHFSDGSALKLIPNQATHVTRLTDSTGGTPGTSLESTGSGTADDNFASLLAKIDELQAALEASGAMAAS